MVKFCVRLAFTFLLLFSVGGNVLSQHSVLRYRERNLDYAGIPAFFSHGKGLPLFLTLARVGVFTLAEPSFTPIEVDGMQNSDGYEYQYICDCNDGGFLLYQRGFLGNRFTRLDDKAVAHKITFEQGDPVGITVRGNGVASAAFLDSNNVGSIYLTVDCARSWFEVSGIPILAMKGAALLKSENPFSYTMARAGLGNQEYPSAVTAKEGAGLLNIALLGQDSLVWTARRRRTEVPDTIWYASIRDSSMKRFDTVLHVIGLSEPITTLADVEVVSSNAGTAFVFHRSGWYARYKAGSWFLIDSLPPMEIFGTTGSSKTSRTNDVINYLSTYKSGSKFVTVVLDSLDTKNTSVTVTPKPTADGDVNHIWSISFDHTLLSWEKTPWPHTLYSEAGGMQLVNSMVRDIGVLPITPVLFGFTDKNGASVVVPYNDCAVLPNESGIGLLKSANFRGERWRSQIFGPRIQSSRGLRTPFIGTDEVIAPGDKVRQFTRDGRFVQMLRDNPATAVYRMPDTTLLVANGAVVTVLRAGGLVDSVDITPVLCSTSAVAGYVNSITMAPDGSLLAFTNGLRLLDLETFGNKPWHCGGIVRSLDTGRTWVKCTTPIETPYFLGSIRTPAGVLVASVSTVVRDTTKQVSDDTAPAVESKNHTFNDRNVIRSTDNGATWTQVYHSPSKSSFKLIGGDGTITKDGTLLLMTTDGVLQSTNDGLDWDFRDITGLEAGSQNVISMFQDTAGSAVYYCTINGLYEEQPLTTVHEENSTATNVHAARTWENHLSAWKKSGIKIKRLFSVLGYEVPTVNPPAGLYLAEYELHSETVIEPILVVLD